MTEHILNNSVERARTLLERQRKRGLFFANDIVFGDPAWELMLELYIASDTHHCVKKIDLYRDLSVSTSIASRWLTVFLNQGYIEICENHGNDSVRMTSSARSECTTYLDSITE